ncbi:MAG: hypothetical protein WC091_25730, partial [Sulfuricellaceae bacterium]
PGAWRRCNYKRRQWNDHCASLRLALHPENRTLQPVQRRFLGLPQDVGWISEAHPPNSVPERSGGCASLLCPLGISTLPGPAAQRAALTPDLQYIQQCKDLADKLLTIFFQINDMKSEYPNFSPCPRTEDRRQNATFAAGFSVFCPLSSVLWIVAAS